MLVLRAQSNCFTHGVRKSRACADQFTFAHAVWETATLRTYIENNYFLTIYWVVCLIIFIDLESYNIFQ